MAIKKPYSAPLHLSIVTQFYPPDYAPTGQLLEELAQQLQKHNIQIKVFTGQPGYAFEQESAPKIERSQHLTVQRTRTTRLQFNRIRGKALGGLLFWLRACLYLLKSSNCGDIVLVSTAPPFLPILGYFIHKLLGRPYICLLYDLHPEVAIALKVVPANHWLVRFWQKLNTLVWRNAARLIVISSTMQEQILRRCPEVADKISVIHNWADPEQIVPITKHHNWFAHTHQLTDQFTVLYSGNMGRCHDIETILDAAIYLQDEPIQFVFIGDGAKRAIALERVHQYDLKQVLFLPYQDRENLPYSLSACDLALVSVSPAMEGLVAPSKLYSALASGRPIAAVCESHSYLCQLLTSAGCGQAFRNGDSIGLANYIRTLSGRPELVKEMGRAGRRYLIQHFTPDIISRQYAQVFWATVAGSEIDSRQIQKKQVERIFPESISLPIKDK